MNLPAHIYGEVNPPRKRGGALLCAGGYLRVTFNREFLAASKGNNLTDHVLLTTNKEIP